MKNLDVKLGLGKTMASIRKRPITEAQIKEQAIAQLEKNKALKYNLEEDNLDLYTSYFAGSSTLTNKNYKKELGLDYK